MADDPTILVTGASGQVGTALRAVLPSADFRSHQDLDVRDVDAVEVASRGKEWIVHAAAFTDVDRCEIEPETAGAINADGTSNVVASARRHGARVLYVSTDYVFPGDRAPYSEDDEPRPVNTYGKTKLDGETHLDRASGDLVVRTSWVYGTGRNFVSTILAAARRGPVSVVDDQVGRPTAAVDLAAAIGALVGGGADGIVHVAGDGEPCSWADLAEAAIHSAGIVAEVRRIDTATHVAGASKVVAPRPPNSTLSIERARALGIPLVDWRTSVDAYVRRLS